MARSAVRTAVVLACLALGAACGVRRAPAHAELATLAAQGDDLALADALEALIAQGADTPADREYAYAIVRRHDDDTVTSTCARRTWYRRSSVSRGGAGSSTRPSATAPRRGSSARST